MNPISGTYLYNSSLMNGSDIFMNCYDVTVNWEKMIDVMNIPTKTTTPNAEIDDMGLKSRVFVLMGDINIHEEKSAANTLFVTHKIIGSIMAFTGSLFFSDGAIATSGEWNVWVKPRTCNVKRSNTYATDSSSIGNVLKYTMEVVETV